MLKNNFVTPYFCNTQIEADPNEKDPLKGLVDLSSHVTKNFFHKYKFLETHKHLLSIVTKHQASSSLKASEISFKHCFTLKHRLLEHYSNYEADLLCFGLLYSHPWYTRFYKYPFTSSYNVSRFSKEDINFTNPRFFKTERVKLTLVFENKEYISINAFTFLPIGNLLDFVVKHPIWTNKYSFTIRDSSFPITLYYFNLTIKHLIDNKILEEGSIIDIQENSSFSIWSSLFETFK